MDRVWHSSDDFGQYEMVSNGHQVIHEMCHPSTNGCDQYSHMGMYGHDQFHEHHDPKNDFVDDCENFNYPGMTQNFFQEANMDILDEQTMTISSTTRRR